MKTDLIFTIFAIHESFLSFGLFVVFLLVLLFFLFLFGFFLFAVAGAVLFAPNLSWFTDTLIVFAVLICLKVLIFLLIVVQSIGWDNLARLLLHQHFHTSCFQVLNKCLELRSF